MNFRLSSVLLAALAVAAPATARAQSATITFNTMQTPSATFAPNNVLAVWIEDADGNFVKTLAKWANLRTMYLLAWDAQSMGNVLDAVSGASWTSHSMRMVTWNLKDANRNPVAPGPYVLRMELADSNASTPSDNNQGRFPFTVGSAAVDTTTSGNRYSNVRIRVDAVSIPDLGTTMDMATSDGGQQMPSGCAVAQRAPAGNSLWGGAWISLLLLGLWRMRARASARA